MTTTASTVSPKDSDNIYRTLRSIIKKLLKISQLQDENELKRRINDASPAVENVRTLYKEIKVLEDEADLAEQSTLLIDLNRTTYNSMVFKEDLGFFPNDYIDALKCLATHRACVIIDYLCHGTDKIDDFSRVDIDELDSIQFDYNEIVECLHAFHIYSKDYILKDLVTNLHDDLFLRRTEGMIDVHDFFQKIKSNRKYLVFPALKFPEFSHIEPDELPNDREEAIQWLEEKIALQSSDVAWNVINLASHYLQP